MNHILKCPRCKEYTLQEKCPFCNVETYRPVPAKYSPEDRYGHYRRLAKLEERKQKGLL